MLIYIRLIEEESDQLKDVDLDPQISLADFRKLIQTVTLNIKVENICHLSMIPKMECAPDEKPTIDLLEKIRIGVYLATKKIEKFVIASGKSVDQLLECSPSAVPEKRVVIDGVIRKQLSILASLFSLEDLIETAENYGVVER
uniref:Uncharacterized protein n=1 Tax=Acrobeloides nanus TaxID=290746 RepID=A0A914BY46_9BILA